MPFYPSPDRDDGYDLTDFYGVDPRLGNHGQLVEVIRTAHDRGINVIADLVVNHTSDQHPWFQARAAQHDQPLSRPLRLERHRAAGHLEAGRLPRPGGLHLGARRPHRGVVPPQLLQAPARPRPRQPRGGGRDPARRRLLAGARLRRLPGRRHPVHGAERREHRRPGPRGRPARADADHPRLPQPPRRPRDDARRGQPAPPPAARVLRWEVRRRAADAVRLHRHAGDLPRAGPRGRRTDRHRTRGAAGHRRRPASGPPSCATTTSSRSTSSATPSARRCSRPSGRSPRCRSTTAASSAGSRPCSAATPGGSGWPTA